ncbi:Ubiquinone/menaquinone biosynthesis C-methyltransferase UbiE [Cytospora mali]|uniref:Ubiquinone/menaquinone biosynthesis C-methyltransferase UbiE n=1 Tax=Cytospora mali TaxID=578113 RepID=A0A194V4R6_CYTMA|nr:Ubiquinone/menaquinone biosynthesis C-methyltransferase UbiE [Valsa mali var. pyri (nom. inval.)]
MAGTKLAQEYNAQASDYEAFTITTPIGRLETELYFKALDNPTGHTILDLGGGTGLRARQALERGAKSVDVVDFSAEMIRIGKKEAASDGLSDRIRWHEADVSKPLGHLGLETFYDVVLANWVFDHADSIEVLERMLGNATSYLKPGGRLICVHIENLRSPLLSVNKYGVSLSNLEETPVGLKYWVTLYGTDPPVEFSGSSLEVLYGESLEIYEKFGLENAQRVPLEDTELVMNDMEFWKECVEQPILRFVTAQKRIE